MGEVWLAQRRDADFEQQVAIKLVAMAGADVLGRFSTERRILSALNHPHIARFVDGGLSADGEPYIAMEYVEGEPLDVHCRVRGLALRERVSLLHQVCEAVAYAQNRLIVHRDLKPGNVLVDTHGQPRVLDFGIAKLLGTSDQPQTVAADRAFTPSYAAPEQVLGDAVTTATDVYALGVMLYELLTGQLPSGAQRLYSQGHSSLRRPSAEVLAANADEFAITTGQTGGPGTLARQLRGDLDHIVQRATQLDPAQRYPNAAQMGEDLRCYLEGHALPSRGHPLYRLSRQLRRHWLVASALLLAVCSLVAGTVLALGEAGRASAEAVRAEAEARKAKQTRDFVVRMLTEAAPLQARDGRTLTVSEMVKAALPQLDAALPDAAEARAELRSVFARVMRDLGEYQTAREIADASIVEIEGLDRADPQTLPSALAIRAVIHGALGDAKAQVADAERALALYEALPSTPEIEDEKLSMHATLAKVDARQGRAERALGRYRSILAKRLALFGPDDTRLAVDYNNVAAMGYLTEHYVEAVEAGHQGLRLLQADPKSPRARQAWMLNSIAAAQIGLGDFSAAEASLRESQQIADETLGADSEPHAVATQLRAAAQLEQGDDISAEREIRAVLERGFKDGTGVTGTLEYLLARILASDGRFDEALVVVDSALTSLQAFRSASDVQVQRAQALKGWIEVALGQRDAGLARVQAARQALVLPSYAAERQAEVLYFAARAALTAGELELVAELVDQGTQLLRSAPTWTSNARLQRRAAELGALLGGD